MSLYNTATLAAAGEAAFIELPDGSESALVHLSGGAATLNATFVFEASVDGASWFGVLAMPYVFSGGTVPNAAQPLLTEAVNAANVVRVYAIRCGQVRYLRVRMSARTAGSATVRIGADGARSIHPGLVDRVSSTLCVTNTAAAGTAVTASLPSVTGLRHYVDYVHITRSAAAALTASATPTLVTTTNLPGSPVFTFGGDAAAQGVDKVVCVDFGNNGVAATAISTATTIVCPATTGVIWRVNVAYRVGL